MAAMFSSLSVRNYRTYWVAGIVSNTGTWMQRTAQDWLVLTGLTDQSGVALGITTGLQFLPSLMLSPWSGLVADRFSKRRVLVIAQSFSGLFALVLGVLVLTGTTQLWHLYLLAFALGVSTAFEGPARQTFVSEMVPPHQITNAVGLNSASFNAGRLLGPAAAGLLIAAIGTGPVFLVNAVSFAATISALLRMRADELQEMPRAPRGRGQIRAGLAYVRSRPDLMVILGVVGTVGMFGLNFQLTMALMATQVFGKGAGEFGLLGSIMAVGTLGGALLAARRTHPTQRLLLTATTIFGVSALVSAAMPNYVLFAVSLVPVGLSALTFMTAANATVQLTTSLEMRGRVMALYMAIFMGGTPVGAPLVGWVGEVLGARASIAVGGVASLLAVLVAVMVLRLLPLPARAAPTGSPT